MQAEHIDRVETALSGVGLLLVFVLALFDLSYQRLRDALDDALPAGDRPVERRKYRTALRRTAMTRAVPPLLVNAVVAYSLAPLAQDVLADGELKFWDFNEALTIFVLLYLLILAFAAWSAVLTAQLTLKLWRTRS